MLSVNFNDYEIRHGIFLVLHFSPGIFWGFDFCPHSIIPVNRNPEYPQRPETLRAGNFEIMRYGKNKVK